MKFREYLQEEFERRRRVNRRYSKRAFADYLAVDHSTLSQILRGRRPAPLDALRRWAEKLGLGAEETALYAAAETAEDMASLQQRLDHMHWLGEANSLIAQPAHWRLLQLIRAPDWRPDMRWAARRTGIALDQLNDALARLLRLGMLRVDADGSWHDVSGIADATEQAIKECALSRLRRSMSAG
jgi:uncharacterized protein (TIGR02147 family)